MKLSFTLVLLCTLYFSQYDSLFVKGRLKTSDKFIFLEKFCYDVIINETGKPEDVKYGLLTMSVSPQNSDNDAMLAMYWDSGKDNKNSWFNVYQNDDLTCKEQLDLSAQPESLSQQRVFNITFNNKRREHWWYFALANCDGKELDLAYTMEFLQPNGSQWGYDKEGVFGMYIFFTVLFLIITGIHLYGDWTLFQNKSLHPIVRLLAISLIIELVSILSYFLHYAVFTGNGVGLVWLETIAEVAHMFAEMIFMLLLILIAKGWAITHQTLTEKKVLLVVLSAFFVSYMILFIFQYFLQDPASTVYIFESAPGIIILAFRFLTDVYFVYCLIRTMKEEADDFKRRFYIGFGMVYTIWFIAVIIIVIIASFIEPWWRFKSVSAIQLSVRALGYIILCALLWPKYASKYFTITAPDLLGYNNKSEYGSL